MQHNFSSLKPLVGWFLSTNLSFITSIGLVFGFSGQSWSVSGRWRVAHLFEVTHALDRFGPLRMQRRDDASVAVVVVWARSIRQRTRRLRWRGVGVIDGGGGGGGKVMGKDWRPAPPTGRQCSGRRRRCKLGRVSASLFSHLSRWRLNRSLRKGARESRNARPS